jgi:hypothetical protein
MWRLRGWVTPVEFAALLVRLDPKKARVDTDKKYSEMIDILRSNGFEPGPLPELVAKARAIGLDVPPELEAPSPVASVVREVAIEEETDTSPTKPKRKLEKGCWRLARPEAFKWLEDNGEPAELGDKAKLEKHIGDFLGTHKEYRALSTIRIHVTRWIGEYEAEKRR